MKPCLAKSPSPSILLSLALSLLLTAACKSLLDGEDQAGKPEEAAYHKPELLQGQQQTTVRQATVVTLVPIEFAVGVGRGTNIEVGFSSDMNAQTVANAITVNVGGTVIAGTTTYDAAYKKLMFDPAQDLPPNSTISVHLAATESQSGMVCPALDWTFTTGN